ncbi:anti-sigma factor antagonist [Streptomyces sp. V2]|uniref:Anti-sigma factor antagonist n=1 Tax=Streptomyces niveiscabiei TaxID=164115 RepID=A0ABW9I2G1_9ACTN|nr:MULTISPECIES: STAS domain-containing protein [Streptomyces]PWG08037.1 anti-sigma factor antagonist [Streptomyces sp. V2]
MTPPANPHARTRSSGRFTVVEVTGEIDLATADLLAEHLDAASRRETPDVLVDLRRVEFFDCSGLRALCRAEERARRGGGRLRLVVEGRAVRRLLVAARLTDRFPPLAEIPGEEPEFEE